MEAESAAKVCCYLDVTCITHLELRHHICDVEAFKAVASSLLIPCINCAEQVALGQGNARRAQADAELYTQEQQMCFSADMLSILNAVAPFSLSGLCMAVQVSPVWVHVASKVWLTLGEQMVSECGAQLLYRAAVQAKALIVKAQAQAQANLYTQEQQVRTSSRFTRWLPWQC